ncbi:unnamed protein product [Hydatigera taeniaeformis]|uniref:Uncharacterized protein n=1 Tax=Hydatigena taeniaeformis TaxID=6205 RepID=A0A3P7FRP9_HYDTA|nr:unnamed protein product [Hydatigera taeniaeformis]
MPSDCGNVSSSAQLNSDPTVAVEQKKQPSSQPNYPKQAIDCGLSSDRFRLEEVLEKMNTFDKLCGKSTRSAFHKKARYAGLAQNSDGAWRRRPVTNQTSQITVGGEAASNPHNQPNEQARNAGDLGGHVCPPLDRQHHQRPAVNQACQPTARGLNSRDSSARSCPPPQSRLPPGPLRITDPVTGASNQARQPTSRNQVWRDPSAQSCPPPQNRLTPRTLICQQQHDYLRAYENTAAVNLGGGRPPHNIMLQRYPPPQCYNFRNLIGSQEPVPDAYFYTQPFRYEQHGMDLMLQQYAPLLYSSIPAYTYYGSMMQPASAFIPQQAPQLPYAECYADVALLNLEHRMRRALENTRNFNSSEFASDTSGTGHRPRSLTRSSRFSNKLSSASSQPCKKA